MSKPCTQCGRCCKATPCGLAVEFLDDVSSPCKALELHDDGKYYCGLVVHPSRYIDVGEAGAWKDEFLGTVFASMLGIGRGCCSEAETEFVNSLAPLFAEVRI